MGGVTDVIRTVDRSGTGPETQVIILDKGSGATESLLKDTGLIADAMPVKLVALVSTANSSVAALGISAVFTGTSEDISAYSSIIVNVFADQASATDGLSIQQSSNGTNWDILDVFTIPASTGKAFFVPVQAKFFRVVYTNGGVANTAFRLQTIYNQADKRGSSLRPQDARGNDNDMEEMLGYNMGFNGTSWDRLRSSAKGVQGANGLNVQDLKDSGRSQRQIFLDSFAVAAVGETLNTMSYSTDNGAVTTGASYAVTAGKRFRLQAITVALHTIAGNTTAVTVIVRIRANNAGAALVSSPIQLVIPIPGIATANGASTPVTVAIPDGWEFVGGAGIGVTTTCAGFVATTAAPKVDITIVGYEY
jgi:hypothetical protein